MYRTQESLKEKVIQGRIAVKQRVLSEAEAIADQIYKEAIECASRGYVGGRVTPILNHDALTPDKLIKELEKKIEEHLDPELKIIKVSYYPPRLNIHFIIKDIEGSRSQNVYTRKKCPINKKQ